MLTRSGKVPKSRQGPHSYGSDNLHQNFGLGNSTTVDNAEGDLRFLFGAEFCAGKLFGTISTIH